MKKWWERFDKTWHRCPYGDGTKQFFWTRTCGLFTIDVEPLARGAYRIGISSLDGSIDNCWHEEFKGCGPDARNHAMKLAYDITHGLANRIVVDALG